MNGNELKYALEAILFAAGEPVPVGRLSLTLLTGEEDYGSQS